MDSSDSEVEYSAQDERMRRAEALRALARSQGSQGSGEAQNAPATSQIAPPRPTDTPRGLRRVWFGLALMLSLLVVVLVTIFSNISPAPKVQKRQLPSSVVITPAAELISCPTDLAWSPDQSKIAIVGYSIRCPMADLTVNTGLSDVTSTLYEGLANKFGGEGHVAIYDTRQGARLDTFSPDSVIYQALHDQSLITPSLTAWLTAMNTPPENYLDINYTHILWSPDQQHVYVTFTCFLPDGPPIPAPGIYRMPGRVAQGLFVSDPSGQNGRVYLHVSEMQSAGAVVWDLTTDHVVGALSASLPFAFQPVATAYSWDDSGSLQSSAQMSAVGVPMAGSSQFSMWQPGRVGTTIVSHQQGVSDLQVPGVFTTNFAAISPDGHLLAASMGVAALLTSPSSVGGAPSIPTPDTAALAQLGWQAAPHVQTRDAGLRAALAMAVQSGFDPEASEEIGGMAAVAWRPDGRLIAVSANTKDHALVILDCASGKQLETLIPTEPLANNSHGTTSLIMWSPDGRRLAYFHPSIGTVTLWDYPWQ